MQTIKIQGNNILIHIWTRRGRASQFSRYLLETAESFDQDTNAQASAVKLNEKSYSGEGLVWRLW
jgi:hypothetical protein